MRRIIVEIATSADGYIARADGSVDWLDRPQTAGDYGMAKFYKSIDTILWGRKTYEVAIGFEKQGIGGPAFDPALKHYAFSRRPPKDPAPGVQFVTEPIAAFAKRLRRRPGKDIWMMGGAEIIGAFLDAGQIDAFRIHVIPTFIGEGIPLIVPKRRTVPLTLRSTRRFSDGVVELCYDVPSRRARG